jgi:hypothetical protein
LGWEGERGTTTGDKGSETGSGNIWSEASSDKRTVESPKAQRSLIGGTGKHRGGKRTCSKGIAHGPTRERLSGRNDGSEGGEDGFGVIGSGAVGIVSVRRIVRVRIIFSIAGVDRVL